MRRPSFIVLRILALILAALVLPRCGANAPPGQTASALPSETVPAAVQAPTLEPSSTSQVTDPPEQVVPTGVTTVAPVATEVTPWATNTPALQATTSPTASPLVATGAPSPSPAPPSPSPVATRPAGPQILSFTVTPTSTLTLGETLSLKWRAVGQKAEICPIIGSGPVELKCQDVPLEGALTILSTEESMTYVALGLRITTDQSTRWSVIPIHLQCQNLRTWFFDDPPPRCPAQEALRSYAAGQYFEHGFMIWIQETDEFYIFYRGPDEFGFQTFDRMVGLQLRPGASEDQGVPGEPPPGYYEPVSGFGLIWRGEVQGLTTDVRQRLGWATEPEFGFDTAHQCETPAHPRSWSCYLAGPRGEVLYLHPDSTAQARFLWEER